MFTLKNALLAVALASQFAMCGLVFGQVNPPLKADDLAAGEAAKVSAMFKGKDSPDAALIKKYVQREVARFVNVTEKSDMGGFATIRTQLINIIRSSASEPAKKIAIDHLLTLTKSIAVSPGFDMRARVNCVAALSELELQSNSPLPETFIPLVNIARDEAQPLPLRAIALYGLNRHVKLTKLPPANAEGLAKVMAVLVASKPKSPLDVKAHAWVVRRGFDVLTSLTANHGVAPAIARLLDDKELPSVRLAAAEYLPHVDQSKFKMTDEQKTQYFVGVTQLLEQQLVMWYEREEDTLNMKSGATGMGMGMGGMGGMGMGGMDGGGEGMGGMGGYDGGMGGGGMAGMGGSEGGYGGMSGGMGGYGMGGEGGMSGPTGPKPRPLDTQPWEVRMTRRNVNQILQIVHTALDGKRTKTDRPVSAVGKGLIDMELPADVANPASDLLKAVESLQYRINDSTKITTMNTLLGQTKKLIERVMDQVREIPALTAQYPKYLEKKEELGEVLDQPKANAPAGDGANPNDPKKEGAGDPPAETTAPGTDAGKAEGN
jgi:hypothetical protein